jgi:hypothetical protein
MLFAHDKPDVVEPVQYKDILGPVVRRVPGWHDYFSDMFI